VIELVADGDLSVDDERDGTGASRRASSIRRYKVKAYY
jgi:hypothetical protein